MKFTEKAKRFFTLKRRANDGFTLVELIVVIAILAILAGVAVPAYSGYIKKAKKAADLQLLGAVNEAFAAACMSEGTQASEITNASPKWNGNAIVGIASVSGADVTAIDEAFRLFYQGNETAEFKVLAKKLVFSNGVFTEMSSGIASILDTILNDSSLSGSIQAVKDSAYNTIGYDVLASNMDNASGMLAEFYGTNSKFSAMLESSDNIDTLLGYLSDDETEAYEILTNMVKDKAEQLKSEYPDITDGDTLANLATGQILANTAILTAANNSSAVNDEFISALENGTAVDMLKNATSGDGATSDTVAQAAFAYAMYTSYQASTGNKVTGEVNIDDVYATLGSPEFQNYMKNDSAADQAGYQGAMDLIASSANSGDTTTTNNILMNGFNNADLVALMQGVIGS